MRAGTCKHYNGNVGTPNRDKLAKCKAGVIYLEVARPLNDEDRVWHQANYPRSDPTWTGIFKRLPCHAENGLQANCTQYCEPTAEELTEQDKLISKMFTDVMTARKAITDYIKVNNLPRSCAGYLDCPICEQVRALVWSRASNGHIHAQCNTEGCVQWME
jgi:hypothetical protein